MQEAWDSIWSAQFTGRRVMIAQKAFEKLFEKNPDTKELFKGVDVDHPDGAKFRAHCVRVVNGLDTIINMAFDTDVLDQLLDHLGDQHAHYTGMKGEYFKLFREAFGEILPQTISCFNSGAWFRCMRRMQDKIGEHVPH